MKIKLKAMKMDLEDKSSMDTHTLVLKMVQKMKMILAQKMVVQEQLEALLNMVMEKY